VAYEMENTESLDEWVDMLKPFYPNQFNLACQAFKGQLPYGLPEWLIESTVASFFNMLANEEAMNIYTRMVKEAKEDPFELGTVEEYNVKTKNLSKAGLLALHQYLRLDKNN